MADPRVDPAPRYFRLAWLTCLAVGVAATLLVSLVPPLRFSYRNPGLHVVLHTTEAMIALFVAYVLYGRFRASRRARDFAVILGLSLLGISNLFFSALPEVTFRGLGDAFSVWAPLGTRLIGTSAFVVGALLPARVELGHRRASLLTAGFGAVTVAFLALVAVNAGRLPPAIPTGFDPAASENLAIAGHPVLVGAQFVMMLSYAVVAGSFLRQAQEAADRVYAWFGAAAVLSAFARLNYFLFPSLYSDFVYVGDVFRLGFYVLLLVGAIHEIRSYWQARVDAEVWEVRNALARNLHDGLAQELVFIAAQSRRFADQHEEGRLLSSASDRAVAEARRAIAALSRPVDEPLADAIAETAEEEVRRAGLPLRLELHASVQLAPDEREALVRIVREAVKNAVRHARARVITVTLETSDAIRLRVIDDGIGMAEDAASSPHAIGIVMMRERARAIDAHLSISAAPGGGTQVEVTLPRP
ncbi:MAG: ATP-binding protein [Actinomycetota bacterium]|nr:ATP-binding protein [Actinomycetota bacterium]